jgi:hypothetical protein
MIAQHADDCRSGIVRNWHDEYAGVRVCADSRLKDWRDRNAQCTGSRPLRIDNGRSHGVHEQIAGPLLANELQHRTAIDADQFIRRVDP